VKIGNKRFTKGDGEECSHATVVTFHTKTELRLEKERKTKKDEVIQRGINEV
jgi:acetamidase/formamidase